MCVLEKLFFLFDTGCESQNEGHGYDCGMGSRLVIKVDIFEVKMG